MNRIIAPGQPPPAARPAMRTGTGILLLTAGAILQPQDLGVPSITADQGGSGLPAETSDDGAPTLADDLVSYEPHH